MSKNILVSLLVLFCIPTLYSQKNFQSGYVVLNNQDTIYGKIQDRNINKARLFEKIKFRADNGGRMKYGPEDLISYTINGQVFESKWFDEDANLFRLYYSHKKGTGEKVFLRLDRKGEMSVYTKEFTDDDCSYIDGFELFLKEGDYYFQRATQGIFGLKKKKLASYFSDCPKLVTQLNDRTFKYAFELADFYNNHCE
ncbi:hypothetical protein ABN763_00805 [Spongiivirga sp. MCCC 1A20706]|uniref:hypothetical protein n=1 Tax=Spongiivirga sp. MCCC 1A20706 TaxID=3160963 RepID=UPI00397751FC